MPGLNKGLAPDFVLSGLDRVFFSAFNQTPGPEYADVSDDMVFKQDNTDRGGVITEQMADAGMWEERQELEDVSEGTIYDGTKRTFTVANFAKSETEPAIGCRITIPSAYPLTTCAISCNCSPFFKDEESA